MGGWFHEWMILQVDGLWVNVHGLLLVGGDGVRWVIVFVGEFSQGGL